MSAANVKISARATSAAPRYFREFYHEPTKRAYRDGGIYHNNPINVADKERKLIWPDWKDAHPDIVLSVGTGYCLEARNERNTKEKLPGSRPGVFTYAKDLLKIAMDHIGSSLDTERTWQDFLNTKVLLDLDCDKFVRFNPKLEREVRLDDVASMNELRMITREQLTNDKRIMEVAHRLIASSFYFEKTGAPQRLDSNYVQFHGECILIHLGPFYHGGF